MTGLDEKMGNLREEAGEFVDKLVFQNHKSQQKVGRPKSKVKLVLELALILFLFGLALAPRLYVIFVVTDPDNPGVGWFGDAYHHWQIAYLTKEIGLKQSFLRLWDLKGMEYFWGLLHPLATLLAFALTGNVTIGLERAVTALGGAVSVVLLYFLGKKYWNRSVGLGAALLAALNPVGVFNDGTGMVESLGIPFLLGGILAWPRKPALSGLLLGIAVMGRSEYWVFSAGLVATMIFFTKGISEARRVALGIGFGLVVLVYMKYLLDYTGNPVYPFWENYLANVLGGWQNTGLVLDADALWGRDVFRMISLFSLVGAGLVFWKRPRGWPLLLLGTGSWLFLGLTFGFSAYIYSWANYVWVVRFMLLQYMFLGLLLAILLFYVLRQSWLVRWLDFLKINWLVLLVVIAGSQVVWLEIMKYYRPTQPKWEKTKSLAAEIARYYEGGGILLPEANPEITYALVRYQGIEGKNIVGAMFDPYFYMEDDPYENWSENRLTVFKWLRENRLRFLVVYTEADRYAKLAEREPDIVQLIGPIPNSRLFGYRVLSQELEKNLENDQ